MGAAQTSLPSLVVGPGDDCAVLDDGTALTTDTLVQGVHFDERISPIDLGYKVVTVSVSDLAATGARPSWVLLNLSLPPPFDPSWVEAFAAGVAQACERWQIALIGGDTTRSSGPLVVSTTAAGRCVGTPLLRSGAHALDQLWVTGRPGLAALGYLVPEAAAASMRALHRPSPPLHFALDLAAERLATAAMDLSDGLRTDLPRLCAASGVGAIVDPQQLPELEGPPHALARAKLAGGDDFELLFTAPPASADRLVELARHHDVVLTPIGHMTRDTAVRLARGTWPAPGFAHFTEVQP